MYSQSSELKASIKIILDLFSGSSREVLKCHKAQGAKVSANVATVKGILAKYNPLLVHQCKSTLTNQLSHSVMKQRQQQLGLHPWPIYLTILLLSDCVNEP